MKELQTENRFNELSSFNKIAAQNGNVCILKADYFDNIDLRKFAGCPQGSLHFLFNLKCN